MPVRFLFMSVLGLAFGVSLFGCADSSVDNSDSDSSSASTTASADGASEENPIKVDTGATATESAETAEVLGPGSPAPPIAVLTWMMGAPIDSFEANRVYVVEFWATWCGPCIQNMPHLAKLQTEYGDDVSFIGVTDEDEETVAGFLDRDAPEGGKWSDVLTYSIVLDDDRKTSAAYMEAANQGGIPTAFIVGKTGNIEWIGHPATIDEPLKQIVDGSWNSETARQEFLAAAKMEEILEQYSERLNDAASAGDFPAAVKLCDEILVEVPGNEQIKQVRMSLLLEGDMIAEFNKSAAEEVEQNFDNPSALAQIAYMTAAGTSNEGRDLDLALKAVLQASELTDHNDGSILNAAARVYFEREQLTEAIEWQKKAIAAAPHIQQLKEILAKYEAKAGIDTKDSEEEKPAAEENPEPEATPAEKTPQEDSAEQDAAPTESEPGDAAEEQKAAEPAAAE